MGHAASSTPILHAWKMVNVLKDIQNPSPNSLQWTIMAFPPISDRTTADLLLLDIILSTTNGYIQKGPDLTSFEINDHDEIKRYMEGRYISPSEAVHHIYQFDVHGQVLNVICLQVHLPGQHMITFNPDDNVDTILDRASHEHTTLTAYFDANANGGNLGEQARKYTYQEFPQHFTWYADHKEWSIRCSDPAIGCMYFVPPTAGECFYLRTLLMVVKGAKSFEDLRRYNSNEPHPTFHSACLARGLLQDDGEWVQCLAEGSMMFTGARLRHLFTTTSFFVNHPDLINYGNNFKLTSVMISLIDSVILVSPMPPITISLIMVCMSSTTSFKNQATVSQTGHVCPLSNTGGSSTQRMR